MARHYQSSVAGALPALEKALFILSIMAVLIVGVTTIGRTQTPPIQPGTFLPGANWFSSPLGGGVEFPRPNDTTIEVDSDGNGSPDTTYNLPPEIRPDTVNPRRFDLQYFLSPTQDALFVTRFGANNFTVCNNQDQIEVYVYGLGNPPNMVSFTGDQGACIQSPINMGPVFYDNACVRTMAVVAAASFGRQAIFWADLVNGVMNLDSNTYNEGVTSIQFAPSGNAALVVHDDRYSLIDLCTNRVAGTPAVSTQQIPTGNGALSARVAQNGNFFRAHLQRNGRDVTGASIALDISCFPCGGPNSAACCFLDGTCLDLSTTDCTAQGSTSDPGGQSCANATCVNTEPQACCFANGTCDDLTETDCLTQGGTPRGVGTTCANSSCPQPR